MIALRDYQQAAVQQLRDAVSGGAKRIVLTLPTGGGKTPLACHIIHSARQHSDARVVFVAPWIQLIDQAVAQLARWGVTDVGVLRGDDSRTNPAAPVQVASRETLRRRALPPASIVIVDECHRAPQSVLELYPDATIIGLSATPVGLKGLFGSLVVGATYKQLIASGHLEQPRCFGSPTSADLSGVRTTAGDWSAGELEAAMMAGGLMGDCVQGYIDRGGGFRAVCFAVGIAHSKQLAARFCAAGIAAEHMDGGTPKADRDAILARLEAGLTRVVCNVGVLTEGWDQPSVRCCILARPTGSFALYKQMVGRVLRPHPSGQPIVIDHAGNLDRHGMPHADVEWSLDDERKAKAPSLRTCSQCFAMMEGGRATCEHCGFVFPVAPRPLPTETAAPLVEKIKVRGEQEAFFWNLVARAQASGFKPGYAGAKFKEKFGKWPPWDWSQTALAAYGADADWQERQMRRAREQAYWKDVNAKAVQKVADPAFTGESDAGDGFADWLAREEDFR